MVEKELLHHDILREMGAAGLLGGLTFIGGTCLRACYGSNRLSEDLDFTGGANFTRDTLIDLGGVLVERLQVKYNLTVTVTEPVRDSGNVDDIVKSQKPRSNGLRIQQVTKLETSFSWLFTGTTMLIPGN